MLDSESDERRDELCQDAVNVLMTLASIQKAIDDANKKKRNTVPAVKLFYYTKSAHCGLVITDSVIRYWPYLHSTDVVDSPALDYPRNSAYAEYYERHFEAIKAEPTTLDDAEKLARDWLRNWRERISKNAEQSVGHGAADNAGSNG